MSRNEAHGLSDEALKHADERLCLPTAHQTESLNASRLFSPAGYSECEAF
ncbi:MAG: hypothetical protein FWC16_00480 [Defluviitaleaceae bacterium]|nr:hypothetical protein [Defluviitaleaceae bacterium]MCL2273379.1 hypothetical protein [Defluviitaleaceae bacterium]